MITKRRTSEVVDSIGRSWRAGTTQTHLRRELLLHGYTLGRFQRGQPPRSGLWLARFKFPPNRKGYHWIAIDRYTVYDPELPHPFARSLYPVHSITSCAPVTRSIK